jgi:serine/threonine protein kinase/tetratricopeptide (TPR) repeat protein
VVSASRREGELGKYELLCLLATGGMASVHLARAKGIGGFEKLLVIKRILPRAADDDTFIRMFLDEARIAATLDHSNIAHVFDVGSVQNEVFLAMEFLHGHDVRSIVHTLTGPVPLDPTFAIAIGICAGLHYAHDKRGTKGQLLGLVHRDVSPSNVVVTYDGGVKVIDFGIAKATDRLGDTKSGILKGKPGYMSPEQCLGMPLDRRSDIFCVGIMLYELTTGTRLFGPKDAEYLQIKAIVESDPAPPSALVPGYPPKLERVVMRALARVPEERYQTALELQRDLEGLARASGLDVSPTGLATFMEATFREELDAWRASEKSGLSLAEHVVRGGQGRCTSLGRISLPDGATTKTQSPEGDEAAASGLASTQLAAAEPSDPSNPARNRLPPPAAGPSHAAPRVETASRLIVTTSPLPEETRRSARRRQRNIVFVAAAFVAIIAMAFVLQRSRPPDVAPQVSSAPAPAATPITSLPLPTSTNREAVAAYAEAMQAMRDGAANTARTKFQRAAELDPMLAAAHLRATMCLVGEEEQLARASFQRARGLRSYLTERDQKFLDALEPTISRTQTDGNEAVRRFLVLSQAYPGDAEIAYELAIVRALAGDYEGSAASARRALALDPDFLLVLGVLGDEEAYLGDIDAGLRTLERCIATSGGATTCALMSGDIRAQRGECEVAAETASRVRANTPGSWGYTAKVEAAVARGESPAVVRQILDQQPETVPWKRARVALRLAALEGDFIAAEKAAREMEAALSSEPAMQLHMLVASQLSEIYAETGRVAEAGKAAKSSLEAAVAWEPEARVDDDGIGRDRTPRLLVAEFRAGLLSKEEMIAKSASWLSAWEVKTPPFYRGYLWVQAYSETVDTADDARQAIDALPRYNGIPPVRSVNALSVGRVYWVAGDLDLAIPALSAEAHSCTAYRWPFEHTRASYMLGRALEAKGDIGGACDAYQAVLAHWGRAKPRSVTAESVRSRISALKCTTNPIP